MAKITLNSLNNELQESNKKLSDINVNLENFGKSVLGIFAEQKHSRLDDLETMREKTSANNQQMATLAGNGAVNSAAPNTGSGLDFGNFLGIGAGAGTAFGLGKLFTGKFLKGLITRGVIPGIALMLSDEIGDYVGSLTNSDMAGNLTEAGLVGGSLGRFLFGGKGLISGAIAAATLVVADKAGKYVEKELDAKNVNWSTVLGEAAKATTTIVGFAIAGAQFGPWGAVAGSVIGAGVALYNMFDRFDKDAKFQKEIKTLATNVKSKVTGIMTKVGTALEEGINAIAPNLIDTKAEIEAVEKKKPGLNADIASLENQLKNMLRGKRGKQLSAVMKTDAFKSLQAEINKLKDERKAIIKEQQDQEALNNTKAIAARQSKDIPVTPDDMDVPDKGDTSAKQVAINAWTDLNAVIVKQQERIKEANESQRLNIPSNIRTMSPRGKENYLTHSLGLAASELTKMKQLSKDLNMSMLDYVQKYGTSGVRSGNTAVDASVTQISNSSPSTIAMSQPKSTDSFVSIEGYPYSLSH